MNKTKRIDVVTFSNTLLNSEKVPSGEEKCLKQLNCEMIRTRAYSELQRILTNILLYEQTIISHSLLLFEAHERLPASHLG